MHSEKEIIFIARESPEGGYEAHSPGYSIYTQADNFEELRAMVHDAVSCHFEEDERPGIIRLHQVLQPGDK
ncbi:MAG: 2-oxoisovalerate dehydrogenase [Methanocalculus sp. MSAO_Arc2]|nr:MAG: 2-oxoisovalerate dehydrogenase [Methanocalculus sp. MSAO_Arc2]